MSSSSSLLLTGQSDRPFPKDDSTIYYLRNSSSQRYLRVWCSDLQLSARKPEEVEKEFYQWRFIKRRNTYNLQNVGNNQYINITGWIKPDIDNKGYYRVSMSGAAHGLKISGGSVFKMGVKGGTTYCVSDCGGIISAVNAPYSQWYPGGDEWNFETIESLLLVNRNPLPKGTYRIRSFHGSYLLTMPQVARGDIGIPYVTWQQDQNDGSQKWSLVPDGNSLYTIRNSGTGYYLAGSSTKLVKGARLIGQSVANETPFQWRIDTFGPGVMFFIGLDDEPLSIGFPNYMAEDLSQVTLQPSDNIPSQIWFFENFEPLFAASYHATEQLVAGTYILKSCHSQQYLRVSTDDSVVSTSDHTKATNFSLEFVANNSANFTLSYSDVNYETYYLSVEKNRLLTSDEDEKSTWVLLAREYKDIGTVYMICDSTSTDPRRVISSRRVGDRKRLYFALDALTEGDSMQFWKFRSVQTRGSTILDGAHHTMTRLHTLIAKHLKST